MLTLKTNVASLSQQRYLQENTRDLATSMQRLSSGFRINSAKDDAAGLQISNRLTSQINGLGIAIRNADDATSMAQTAEGALQEVTNILQRMRDLSVQASNGSLSTKDRQSLDKENQALKDELDRINQTTSFGGQTLFNTAATSAITDEAEVSIIGKLQSGMLAESEDIIFQELGLRATAGTNLKIDIEDIDPFNVGGFVQYAGSTPTDMRLMLDAQDFGPGGAQESDLAGVVLHEMVHAVMLSKIPNASSLPTWFMEGSAEFISGADQRLKNDIATHGINTIVTELDSIKADAAASSSTGLEIAGIYSGGYIAMRYLEDKVDGTGIKAIMADLVNGDSLDTALNNNSSYANVNALFTDMTTANGGGTNLSVFVTNQMDLNNGDNGASGGLDTSGGSSRNPTIQGSNTSITTSDFSTSVVTGDDNSDIDDFTVSINWSGFNQQDLSNYSPTVSETELKTTEFQIGADANQTVSMSLGGFSSAVLGLNYNLVDSPQMGMSSIDAALEYVDGQRAELGAVMNRLDNAKNNLTNIQENISASRARIRDVDFASETANLASKQIQQQAITAMMVQSNQQSQLVLQLLG